MTYDLWLMILLLYDFVTYDLWIVNNDSWCMAYRVMAYGLGVWTSYLGVMTYDLSSHKL